MLARCLTRLWYYTGYAASTQPERPLSNSQITYRVEVDHLPRVQSWPSNLQVLWPPLRAALFAGYLFSARLGFLFLATDGPPPEQLSLLARCSYRQ